MPTSKEELLRRGLHPHDIQHNQHRRAEWQDYSGTGLYMITLCIEGRRGLFGYLEGDIRAQRGSSAFPHTWPCCHGRGTTQDTPSLSPG